MPIEPRVNRNENAKRRQVHHRVDVEDEFDGQYWDSRVSHHEYLRSRANQICRQGKRKLNSPLYYYLTMNTNGENVCDRSRTLCMAPLQIAIADGNFSIFREAFKIGGGSKLTVEAFKLCVEAERLDFVVWMHLRGCPLPTTIPDGIKNKELVAYLRDIIKTYPLDISDTLEGVTAFDDWCRKVDESTNNPPGLFEKALKCKNYCTTYFSQLQRIGYPFPCNAITQAIKTQNSAALFWLTKNPTPVKLHKYSLYTGIVMDRLVTNEQHFNKAVKIGAVEIVEYLLKNDFSHPDKAPRGLYEPIFDSIRAKYYPN